MKTIYSTLLLALVCCTAAKAQYTVTLNPVQDAYFITMGGGQGMNTMLKFDISSLPPGANITSAVLQVYVWDTIGPQPFNTTAKLGNMRFMNLHGHQGWTEADSSHFFNPFQNVFSDTVNQLTGFGNTIGWASSLNLKGIIDEDHVNLRQFCTIFMKDTDDVTCCSGPGVYLTDSPDSLIAGNKLVGGDQIIFYPREKANYMPKLTIIYSCSVSSSQNLTICSYDSVMVGTHVHKTTGTYIDTLMNVATTCDSIVTTNLTVKPALDLSVTVSSNTLTANENGATYQWIDCNNNNTPMGGETNQVFVAGSNGQYAVIVTKNACSDTSACSAVGSTNMKTSEAFARTYPNPVKDVLHVEMEKGMYEVTLCDVSGRVIYHSTATGNVTVDMKNENKGLYLLKITGEAGSKVMKIVKD